MIDTARAKSGSVPIFRGSLLQISVSRGGIPKRAIAEGQVSSMGIDGDSHAHPDIHGGSQQALLLITAEGIEELAALGFPLTYGSLGENLTTRGIGRREWRSGQRWRIGAEVVIEITKRRAPCKTLNAYPGIQAAIFDAPAQAGDPSSPKWGLSGFYASVVQPGVIRPSDEIILVP
jgi:MOSC domain-containing protein YiiM